MTRSEDWADYLDPSEPGPDLPPEQRLALDRVTTALASSPVWDTPPPSLRAGLLQAAAAEQAAGPVPGQAPGRPALPVTDAGAAPIPLRRRPRRVWYAVLGAAAAAALVLAIAWPRPEVTTFPLAGTALAPKAHAVAELEPRSAGLAIRLEIKGLPPAPAGGYYAAWLRGPEGVVPVGTFHWRKGGIPIDLWSGVDSARYPELFVTVQREGQPPTPSAEVVLTGRTPG
jgi:Anti-sigma-K factor rskA